MRTTIDKAGRVVIPASIREKAGLVAGTPLEVTLDGFSVRLVRAVPGPKLTHVGKILVSRPTVPRPELPAIDVGELIDEERDRWPL